MPAAPATDPTALDGSHLWIANTADNPYGDSVTDVKASDGSWVRTLSNPSRCGISSPLGVVFDGSHVWIIQRRRELNNGDERF